MVGEIVVMPSDGTISIGYTFHYAHHRRGYAFEALNALINRLHNDYPNCDFISFSDPGNEPSMVLLNKLGYILSKEAYAFGKWLTPATEAEISEAVN